MDDREEQNWAGRARAGDRDAFARLVERYWGRVYRWLHGLTMRRHLAEDLTQEVFLRAWSALPQLRQAGGRAGRLQPRGSLSAPHRTSGFSCAPRRPSKSCRARQTRQRAVSSVMPSTWAMSA